MTGQGKPSPSIHVFNGHFFACFFILFFSLGIKAQDLSATDPVVQKYISESNQIRSAYKSALTEKKALILSRQLLSLQPLVGYLDIEIANLSGDQSNPRLMLSDITNPNVAALKATSAAMFATLLSQQTAFEQQQRQLLDKLEDEAKKLKWNEARLALGRAALTNSGHAEKQGSDLSALVKSVKELKIPSSILTNKSDKIYYISIAEGGVGLTPEQALEIAHAQFPNNEVHLFGPADSGNNLKDCYRAISGKGIENRCYINAGWNQLTGTLKLPVEGGSDFQYQEVAKPSKSDLEYITIVAGAPDPKDPKSILAYTIEGTLKPFWVKTFASAKNVYGILVTVKAVGSK